MAEPGLRVVIGPTEQERLIITALGRMHPGATDYWDGNWLVTPIEVRVGDFTGRVGAAIRTSELLGFRDQLRRLYETLTGDATLESIEDWIALKVEGDGAGHLAVTGTVRDQPGIGNTLRFSFRLDQTYLPAILDQLDAIDHEYPVLGHP